MLQHLLTNEVEADTHNNTGTVQKQWLNAIVTPVPKVAKPDSIADYRPISVTPLLSRLAEKLVVGMLDDQFGFRPTGSTTLL